MTVSIAVFLAVVTLWDYTFLKPALTELEHIHNGITKTFYELEDDNNIIRNKEKIEEAYQAKETFIKQFSGEPATAVATEISKFATEANLKPSVKLISPGEEKPNEYTFDIECQGEWPKIFKFFYEISDAKFLLSVKKFTLTPPDPTNLKIGNVKMFVYYIIIP